MECTIKTIIRKDKNKEGKPYVNKKGEAFTLISLQVEELPSEWMSGFANDYNAEWKTGDTIDIEITEKQVGERLFKNFKNLSKKSSRLDSLEARVSALEGKKITQGETHSDSPETHSEIQDDISTEEIPF